MIKKFIKFKLCKSSHPENAMNIYDKISKNSGIELYEFKGN